MMYPSDGYSVESIMVHEFGHTVMDCGFHEAQLAKACFPAHPMHPHAPQ